MVNYQKLDGWQRLGIVLFVLWVLMVAAYSAYELIHGSDSRMLLIHMKEIGQRGGEGSDGKFRVYAIINQAHLVAWRVILVVIAPPIVILSCAATTRWVMAGFRQKD